MSNTSPVYKNRRDIYYWKCDRPAAFHGTIGKRTPDSYLEPLQHVLAQRFPGAVLAVRPADGQGNHVTFIAGIGGVEYFVRVEDGPERDDYIEVESHILELVRACGLPAPRVIAADATRNHAPFAWQVLEKINAPDMNQLLKQGQLDLPATAEKIGTAVARWQSIQPAGFGPFDPDILRNRGSLQGLHKTYTAYFFLNLERHLAFLVNGNFFDRQDADDIYREIENHRSLLDLQSGCLVHKDLALWNMLGTERDILAFIDWDDAIAGDPMDDLSLLGCFYDGAVLARALKGYASIRPLPPEYRRRFWMHLLRNMLFKSVIRVGAGYFDRDDSFFLIGGAGGAGLKTFTYTRIVTALKGLRENQEIETV